MDGLSIQRSLTTLEERYRELREIGGKRMKDLESGNEVLSEKLAESEQKLAESEQKLAESERKLADSSEESELLLLQLHQVQEELEHYFLMSRDLEERLQLSLRLQQRSMAMLDLLNPLSKA